MLETCTYLELAPINQCGEKIQGAPSPTSKAVKWYWISNMLLVILARVSASNRTLFSSLLPESTVRRFFSDVTK